MYLSPIFYQKIVRPKFAIEKYIQKILEQEFNFGNSKVLDFGCGTGSNSFIFKPENYLGVDVDEKRIDFASKLFSDYTFEVIINNTLPVDDNSIDYICIFATIHHISDDIFGEYVKEFKRVLKPEGKIVVIEPVFSEEYKFNNWFMKIFDDGEFIRDEAGYEKIFGDEFKIKVHKRFRKFLFYNELFFSASHK